jgi:hypothetical protein
MDFPHLTGDNAFHDGDLPCHRLKCCGAFHDGSVAARCQKMQVPAAANISELGLHEVALK